MYMEESMGSEKAYVTNGDTFIWITDGCWTTHVLTYDQGLLFRVYSVIMHVAGSYKEK
jgi:hypothetical protein